MPVLQQVSLEAGKFTAMRLTCYADGWYLLFHATLYIYFTSWSLSGTQKDDLLIEPVVFCSFEGTGIHEKGKPGEQLGYKR